MLYAARNCFEKMGYDAVRVEDITDRVGVAKGSFYYYFSDKQDIVIALMEEEIAASVHDLTQAVSAAEDGIVGLTLMLKQMFAGQEKLPTAGYFGAQMPGWFHSQFDDCRDRYMLPLCRDIAWRCVGEDLVRVPHAEMMAELLYLGSSGWMHLNYEKMADPEFAKAALKGLEVYFNRLLDPVRKIELEPRG